jgi:hypothetical protein
LSAVPTGLGLLHALPALNLDYSRTCLHDANGWIRLWEKAWR